MKLSSPNPIDIAVGANIRLIRKQKGLSQSALAEALGLTFQQIQKYERGANRISASKLLEAARVLEAPISSFFAGVMNHVGVEDGDARGHLNLIQEFAMIPGGTELAYAFTQLSKRTRHLLVGLARELSERAPR